MIYVGSFSEQATEQTADRGWPRQNSEATVDHVRLAMTCSSTWHNIREQNAEQFLNQVIDQPIRHLEVFGKLLGEYRSFEGYLTVT